MKNLYSLVLIFLLFQATSCDKNKTQTNINKSSTDSLNTYLNFAADPSLSQAKKNVYNTKAFKVVLSQKNDSLNRDNLTKIAGNYFMARDWPSFKKSTTAFLQQSLQSNDTVDIAKSYRFVAEYYKNVGQNDSAYYFYLKAEKLYTKLNDRSSLGKVFLKKGMVQFLANDYLGADISISQAYNLLKHSDDKQTVYQAISMMAIIANEMKDYKKAIEDNNEALILVREANLNNNIANPESVSLNNIGNVYQNLNNNEEAIINFNLALKNKNLATETPDLYTNLIDNLAYSRFKLKIFTGLPELFFESMKIRDSLGLTSGVILSNIHISEFYAQQKDTIKSQAFANAAIALAKKSKTPSDILASLKQLTAVDHKKAQIYSKEYIRINDSLQQAERKSQNKFARIQLETDEIIHQKDKLAEQNRDLLYVFLVLLSVGVLLFVIRTQRAKNRELVLKQQQQKANEDIYNLMMSQQSTIEGNRVKEKKRIAQELHDGVLGRLFGARLNLDSLNKMSDQVSIDNRLNYLTELKNIEQDIREISHDLSREQHSLINNFIAIVNNLLDEQRSSFGTKVKFSMDNGIKWDFINNQNKINLYRMLQESLQNINKYAEAKTIVVEFKKESTNIILKIADDGLGFEMSSKKKGIGLQNMASRTQDCNGTLDIVSSRGKGTSIIITIPESTTTVNA